MLDASAAYVTLLRVLPRAASAHPSQLHKGVKRQSPSRLSASYASDGHQYRTRVDVTETVQDYSVLLPWKLEAC